jgi:DNA invertase Pin-like site-specific DNA recombinase
MNQQQPRACLFVRVSRDQQDYQRQINDLEVFCRQKNYAVVKIIAAKVSGAKTHKDRDDLKELFSTADKKMFDKVVVSEVSRLGRNARDLRETVYKLHEKKIPVVFQNLGGMESLDEKGQETFVTNIILSIYAELSQEERRLLSERVRSGLATAKLKGKKLGRPEGKEGDKALLKKYAKLAADVKRGLSLTECQKLHSVARNTVIKVKKAIADNTI